MTGHLSISTTRRSLLAGTALLGPVLAGCLSPSSGDSADELRGQVVNDTADSVTVTLGLEPTDDSRATERNWSLDSDEYEDFRFDTPRDASHISIAAAPGPSTTIEWDGNSCQSWLHVSVESGGIAAEFGSC